jgi:GNAT superfamily N-acetyltransferase
VGSGDLRVRHVLTDEHPRLRELRLASVAADPEAFGSTPERESERPRGWWEERAARSDDGSSERVFVLEDHGGRWLGLAFVRVEESRPRCAALTGMWVAPAARGRGGGALLCDACIAWAAERGLQLLTLDVVVGNDRAVLVYESAGFAMRERSTWSRDGRTLEVLVMTRGV